MALDDVINVSIEGAAPGAIYVMRSKINCRFDGLIDLLHVISKPARGEIRGYKRAVGTSGPWKLRLPCWPVEWPELDAAVSAAIGEQIDPPPQEVR